MQKTKINDNRNTKITEQDSSLQRNPVYPVIALICILSLIAFTLTCRLAIANTPYEDRDLSLAETMLGDTRVIISSQFYTRADLYFHRGVPHTKERAFKSDPFQMIHDKVSPSKHTHLHGAGGIKEIMPWLDLSIRANPKNLDSYLVASFWLSSEADRPDLALQILDRAQCNIPYSYKTQLEKGRILLHNGQLTPALQAFSASISFWNKTADPADAGDLLNKSQALLYRALLYENSGMINEAIADLKAMPAISPASPEMQKRLAALQSGKPTTPPAHDLLASMLHKYDKQRRRCEHEDHDHEEESHSDESGHNHDSDEPCEHCRHNLI